MSNSNQDHQDAVASGADQADAIVDEDFEITDLENQPAAKQPAAEVNVAGAYEAQADPLYQTTGTHAIDETDSNMQEHLPPIDNDSTRKAEKARLKQEKLEAELAAIKAMSLENKLALLKKYVPQDFYKLGHFVDACDTTDQFCFAKIMQINANQGNIQVNFDGWSNKWDQWYRFKSSKVAPFRSQHKGYSGQTKTALRNHVTWDPAELQLYRRQIDQMIANDLEGKSAHDTTQYLRGHLYVYSDFLLGHTFNDNELPEVIQYQKAVLRLVVTYLRKVQTMQKSIYELSQNNELFLVDPMCAILASYPELMDMVKRLFACCQRALRFYLFNDVAQVDPSNISAEVIHNQDQITQNSFGVVIQDFLAYEFKSQRIVDENKYSPDDSRTRVIHKENLVFGQMLNFVQYFADIGGFDAVLGLLKLGTQNNEESKEPVASADKPADYSGVKIDLFMLSYLLTPFKNLGQVLTPEFKQSFCKQVKELVVSRLTTMTEKNLKDADKDAFTKLISALKQFLQLSYSEKETAKIIETTQLYVSLRYLQCGNLEKRLKGLNEIRTMVERVIQQTNKKQDNRKKYMLSEDAEETKVQPSEFLTAENLIDWIHENKVLEIILSGSNHQEIVKRCGPILKFVSVYSQGRFDASTVALVWKCQLGKHEEMVRTVYNLILEIMPFLSIEVIDLFYSKIEQMPPQQYDEKFLVFLSEYTKLALSTRYKLQKQHHVEERQRVRQEQLRANEIDLDQDEPDHFDGELGAQEKQILGQLQAQNLTQFAELDVAHMYGLPIFWAIAQDSSLVVLGSDTKHAETLRKLSLQSMLELFDQNFRRKIRLTYLLKSLNNLVSRTSVVQSLQVATTIIKSFYIDQVQEQRQYTQWGDDAEQPKSEDLQLISLLQQRLGLIDIVISNIQHYHDQVKHKLKVLLEKNKVPENVDEYSFAGSYSHSKILEAFLDFIEYIVIQSQNDGNKTTDVVSIGILNIQTLWQLFVSGANFNQDQNLFLTWINKQRLQQVRSQQQYYNGSQLVTNEQQIFTEDEKKYLFQNILCDPTELKNMTLNLVKVFHKYFKSINKAEQNLAAHKKKIKVLRFDQLLGMDTLWQIALTSQNEKVKQLVHELLVDLHLKFDHPNVTQEHKSQVLSCFVQRCMHELEADSDLACKKSAVQLISLFLDRYEGIRPILPEAAVAQRLSNVKPQTITVMNCIDLENKSTKQIQTSYFQTLGYVRNQIAQAFGLEINEFLMIIRSNQIDADTEDDTYIKDIQNLVSQVTIKLNKNYNPRLHPKYLLSNNEKHFNSIFSMLKDSTSDASLTELLWALIMRLPQNQTVIEQFDSLSIIKTAAIEGPDKLREAWSQLLDEKAVFNLLYCLRIIKSSYISPQSIVKQRQTEEEEKTDGKDRLVQWRTDFVRLGGFTHLLYVLANLNLDQLTCTLELVCIKTLLEITFTLMVMNGMKKQGTILEMQDTGLLRQIVLKLLRYIQLICHFSIKKEAERGESIESIETRIAEVKLRKDRYKLMIKGNKADSVKKQDDDDADDTNEDKKLLQSLKATFNEQTAILEYLFNFLNQIFAKNAETIPALVEFQHLDDLFICGMLLSENPMLRSKICQKFSELIKNFEKKAEMNHLAQGLLMLELNQVLPLTQQHEKRSNVFYEVLQDLIAVLSVEIMIPLLPQSVALIEALTEQVIQRETKEQTTADKDTYLQGQMQVLSRLLQKFPEYKLEVGNKLTHYLIHQCLFEIPQGNQGLNSAPKCKNVDSRRAAFSLLATLSRDCLENLNMVLKYMHKFSSEVSWRTKKESDWNIKFFDDEKSSTGHVGIKNLGCICYMNSLNQQLFMIPGFRNDVLSIKDPNHDKNSDENNMFLQWQNLFAGLLLSEKMYVNPKAYCHSFKDWEGQPINTLEQMDVEEYLNMFMDKLESAIKGTAQEKTIQYHFGGTFANEIICKTCPHSYIRTENFLNVGIPVMNKKNLQEGLDAFVKGDMLEEGNQYFCEKCDKKVDALKRTCFQTLPRYMIMALKRFEFDYERMQRVKLNDFYEFKEEIDVAEYTHEYLSAKEKSQKAQKIDNEETKPDSKEELLKTLLQPRDYYQYELVGVVVHSGTADSGHYYSYIKEQEKFKAKGSNKWYEFNDIWVKDFDPSEIPSECYGGEETAYSNNAWGNNQQQKYMKFRNAYLLVYKRKLDDDSKLVKKESEDQQEDTNKYQLGSQELQLDVTSHLYRKIAADNHKYWQNRFLFGSEYFEFVQQVILYWNTNRVIPFEVSWRNNDYHLLNPVLRPLCDLAKLPMPAVSLNDVKVDLKTKYTVQEVQTTKLQVFKFATQFYVSILQRAFDKNTLPDTVKYIRTYINDDETCARWLISEFVNSQVLTECFLENTITFMRQILAGLLYCAMLKVWESDRRLLKKNWDDISKKQQPTQATVLGNFILCLLSKLPQVLDYSNNHSQWFQLLARFSNLGPEARLFLLNAGAIDKCMNFFHIKDTPYQKEFLEMQLPQFTVKEVLDIGLPTQDDPHQKVSLFSQLKEKQRQKKLYSENPKYLYLIETVSNCLRSLHVESPFKLKEGTKTTPFQHEDSGFVLSEHETTLIMPQADFIEKLVVAATKPRSMSALAKGYIHWCYYNTQSLGKMWETVQLGLKKYDWNKIRPFLLLFQHMLEARDSPAVKQLMGSWLEELFTNIIRSHVSFYQWMESLIDFVIKIGLRVPECKTWLVNNYSTWSYLFDWLKANPEPPQSNNYYGQTYYQERQSNMKLNKHKYTKAREPRYDKAINQSLFFFRRTYLIHLKDPNHILDLSRDNDLDQLDLTDFKFSRENLIEYGSDLIPMRMEQCVVKNELEELLQIKWTNADKQNWEAPEKNKIYPAFIVGSTTLNKELKKIYDAVLQKQTQERIKQQQLSARMNSAQDQNWEGNEENGSAGERGQDADMEFEEHQNPNGGYTGQYAQEPHSNPTVGYSPHYGFQEGSDEEFNQ